MSVMQKKLTVSVVIPAYNCESTIRQTIESCFAQTLPCHEIIVVDDGSTDSTAKVLLEFGNTIRVIHQENRGLAAARNLGISRASGDYIAWLDADDLAEPPRFEIQSRVLERYRQLILVHSEFTAFGAAISNTSIPYSPTYYPVLRTSETQHPFYAHELLADSNQGPGLPAILYGRITTALIRGNFVHPPTIMMRRADFEKTGPLDESMQSGCDYDFILRTSLHGEFGYLRQPLLRYRISSMQLSGRFPAGETMLENVRILEKLGSVDPLFYSEHRNLIARRISMSFFDAARQIGESRRGPALALWYRGLNNADFGAAVRTLFRILAPRPLMHVLRGIKHHLIPAKQTP